MPSWLGNGQTQTNSNKRLLMNDNLIRAPARSLKEQFSRSSAAWKEQSDPIFRFWAAGDSWGFPLFSLSASRYFGDKETLCLYWPLGTVVITGPKVLDFYGGFCAHRTTCLKADAKLGCLLLANGNQISQQGFMLEDPSLRAEFYLTWTFPFESSFGH